MSDLSDALDRVRELLRHVAADPQAELVLREHAVTAWDLLAGKGGEPGALDLLDREHAADGMEYPCQGAGRCSVYDLLAAATEALEGVGT